MSALSPAEVKNSSTNKGNKGDFLIDLENQYGANNYHPLNVVLEKGEGVWVYDVEGKKYLDCLSAYSAVNQGHCNPRLLQKLVDQASKLTLTSRAFRNDQLGPFCKEICELTGYEMVLPMNSGAEAVETAIKAARKWAYNVKNVPDNKAEIITCHNNFHGRTISIISFSSEPSYQKGFGPFTPGFTSVEYGSIEKIEAAMNDNTAAVLIEPIQGEGGVVVPPEGYLKKLSSICQEKNILLIADEIQTGLGRTGKLLACQHEEVTPDVVILGKALSGGFYPVSAVLASKEVLGVFSPGEHGSTFGGNPLGMSLAREALKILVEEKLIENAAELGEYFLEGLRKIETSCSYIECIRGKGLMIGVVLTPEAKGARRFCEALQKEGILCKETHENVIRFAPPLVITKTEIDWALDKISQVMKTL